MTSDHSADDDENYASSEDSDFAPEDVQENAVDQSEDEDDGDPEIAKRVRAQGGLDEQDAGYDNSGDEAIIKKGHKRRKRAHNRGEAEDDEGGEGGLVKTRAQRAIEKEERKYTADHGPVTVDVDALWEQMVAGAPLPKAQAPPTDEATNAVSADKPSESDAKKAATESAGPESDAIRIKRTYNFAGQVHTEEKVVARDSAEAKLYLASQDENGDADADISPSKRATRKAFRSAFEPIVDAGPGRTDLNLGLAARIQAGQEARAKKLNTVEKSRMDWAGYVDKEGIKDELTLASKSKGSYAARQDFLARSEAIRDDEARRARIASKV